MRGTRTQVHENGCKAYDRGPVFHLEFRISNLFSKQPLMRLWRAHGALKWSRGEVLGCRGRHRNRNRPFVTSIPMPIPIPTPNYLLFVSIFEAVPHGTRTQVHENGFGSIRGERMV
jgi:hypothetical protein